MVKKRAPPPGVWGQAALGSLSWDLLRFLRRYRAAYVSTNSGGGAARSSTCRRGAVHSPRRAGVHLVERYAAPYRLERRFEELAEVHPARLHTASPGRRLPIVNSGEPEFTRGEAGRAPNARQVSVGARGWRPGARRPRRPRALKPRRGADDAWRRASKRHRAPRHARAQDAAPTAPARVFGGLGPPARRPVEYNGDPAAASLRGESP